MALSNNRIVFDTNMLLALPQFKVNVFEQVQEKFGGKAEFVVTKSVLTELERLGKEEKQKRNVVIAREAMNNAGVQVVEGNTANADDDLLKLAEEGFYVASNDKILRKRIKSIGGRIIYLRQKKLIETE